ncbi:MAG: TIGR03905 family TSCPD domain-containing protein [Treponema sp.]|nr:TIGR03905 family TSCPD domain-containing protein [Treponema sp.]MCR5623241.1 TIGR03905 family TSCPD domain-containing protein [Treponema sp.]
MKDYSYNTSGTCAKVIHFTKTDDGKITNVSFEGGCNGNLKAVSKLVDGMTAQQIHGILSGNLCGSKGTSCADQLAKAVMTAD